MVHQDLPHCAGGDGQEVRPVPGHQTDRAELEVGLVHEGGGIERALAILPSQLPLREPPEIVVHEGDEPLERGALPLVRGPQQPRDLADIELWIVHDRAGWDYRQFAGPNTSHTRGTGRPDPGAAAGRSPSRVGHG